MVAAGWGRVPEGNQGFLFISKGCENGCHIIRNQLKNMKNDKITRVELEFEVIYLFYQ